MEGGMEGNMLVLGQMIPEFIGDGSVSQGTGHIEARTFRYHKVQVQGIYICPFGEQGDEG